MSLLLFLANQPAAAVPVSPPVVYVSPFEQMMLRVDRAAMRVFGERVPIVYAPAVGAPVSISGIFDANYVLVTGSGSRAGVEAVTPAVFLRLDDVPADPELDDPTLTIRGVDYSVHERRPDGVGGIVLALRRSS